MLFLGFIVRGLEFTIRRFSKSHKCIVGAWLGLRGCDLEDLHFIHFIIIIVIIIIAVIVGIVSIGLAEVVGVHKLNCQLVKMINLHFFSHISIEFGKSSLGVDFLDVAINKSAKRFRHGSIG